MCHAQGTLREAQRALSALVAEVSAGQISSSSTTLGELLTRWLEHIEDQLSPTTAREYRRLVTNMIGPDLGRTRLGKLTTQRLDAYYAALVRQRGLSPGSVRHVHAVLRGTVARLRHARRQGGRGHRNGKPPRSDTGVRE